MLLKILFIAQLGISFILIALVLMQKGKGATAGAGFGAGASGTVFGARGSASFLTRTTAVFATIFIVNSLALAYISKDRDQLSPTSILAPTETSESATPEADVPSFVPDESTPASDEELPALPESLDPVDSGQPEQSQPSGDAQTNTEPEQPEPAE